MNVKNEKPAAPPSSSDSPLTGRRIGLGVLLLGSLAITVVGITVETGNMLDGGKPDAYLGAGMIVFFIAIALACVHAIKSNLRHPFLSVVGAGLVGFAIAGIGNIVDLGRAGELEAPVARVAAVLLLMGVGATIFYFASLPRAPKVAQVDPASQDPRPE